MVVVVVFDVSKNCHSVATAEGETGNEHCTAAAAAAERSTEIETMKKRGY